MTIHDVSEYITWNLPVPVFFIEDLLPQGGTMLVYGDPKVRKSWLVEQMAMSISVGDTWLGFRTRQGRVLICQFEISSYAYHDRLRQMGRHYNLQAQKLYEDTKPLTYLDDEEVFNRFVAEIRESGILPEVIILDCMSACFGGDENNGEQMAEFIRKMVRLKDEFGASLVIVHHANKGILNPNSVSKARGHSRLTGWVDTLMYMLEQPAGVQLQIKARQSIHELPNINIKFEEQLWTRR